MPQWIRLVIITRPKVRLSKKICQNPSSKQIFEFPNKSQMEQYIEARGVLPILVGFLNNTKAGDGHRFNFVLSNGDKSVQADESTYKEYLHLLPCTNKIKSVLVYH